MLTERIYYRSPFSNVSLVADLKGDFDCTMVEMAVKETIERFEILKVAIVQNPDGECNFILLDNSKVIIECNCDRDEVIERAEYIDRQRKFFYRLSEGETAVICLDSLSSGVRISINVHHIIADGLSLVFLLKEILKQLSGEARNDEYYPIDLLNTKECLMSEGGKKRKYLFKQYIEKRWLADKKIFTDLEYKSMFEKISSFDLKIKEVIIEHDELLEFVGQCKIRGVTVTAALIAKIFCDDVDVAKIEVPVNVRNTKQFFGNYASLIQVLKKDMCDSDFWNMAKRVQKIIKNEIECERETLNQLSFLSDIDCNLYDSIFFALYGEYKNRVSNEVVKLLGMSKEDKRVIVSNLGRADFSNKKNIRVENVFFYPSAAEYRRYIVGIITNSKQMTITFQTPEKKS